MSWKDRMRSLITGETPEQRAIREASEAAELEAYSQSLIEANMREAAVRSEQAKLNMATHGDQTKVDIAKMGLDQSKSLTSKMIDRMEPEMSAHLDRTTEDIILARITDPARRKELKKIGLQSAEGYWAELLQQPTISMTAARIGNQRLREIRYQLNPPKPGPSRA